MKIQKHLISITHWNIKPQLPLKRCKAAVWSQNTELRTVAPTYLLVSVLPLLSFLSLTKSEWKSGFKGITSQTPITRGISGFWLYLPTLKPNTNTCSGCTPQRENIVMSGDDGPQSGHWAWIFVFLFLFPLSSLHRPRVGLAAHIPPSPSDCLRQGARLELTSRDPLGSTSISLELHIDFIP